MHPCGAERSQVGVHVADVDEIGAIHADLVAHRAVRHTPAPLLRRLVGGVVRLEHEGSLSGRGLVIHGGDRRRPAALLRSASAWECRHSLHPEPVVALALGIRIELIGRHREPGNCRRVGEPAVVGILEHVGYGVGPVADVAPVDGYRARRIPLGERRDGRHRRRHGIDQNRNGLAPLAPVAEIVVRSDLQRVCSIAQHL